jgi:putative transposase
MVPKLKTLPLLRIYHEKLPLEVRLWECSEYDTIHARDINAAKNIKAAGLAVLALGENVSRV